ncbi:hypothetical protein CBR_g40555 [Chara braunii]|uniref:Uncharacterized protein n=1 Tax=Chara braunii TaxID=69332 RepID=A0A388K252_CHABU|nr:hypothetical protein CBR_g40555 [Chara braunii]|eukprot:GBG64107.1 hypothetical protein CBR_g40555 [Chara braunii]
MARRMTFWVDRPRGILPPRISEGRAEIRVPARNAVSNPVMDWVGVELVEDTVCLVVELEWRARGEFGGVNLDLPGRVHATGSLHLSEEEWRTFGIALASGDDPVRMFEGAWQITWREGFEFADPERDDVTAELRVDAAGIFELPNEVVRMKLGKMATEEETDNCKSEGEQGLGGSAAQSEGGQKDRESINPDGTKGNRKEISTGESSGKVGGSRQGTQKTKEGRNKDRTNPRNSERAMSKKAQVSRPALPPQEAVVPPGVANRGFGRRDPANEQCKYCTAMGHYVRACSKLNHDILKRRCSRSLKGKIFGPQRERVNWNSPGGMRRAVIMLNGLEIAAVEAEPVVDIVWDQLRGRGSQVNFILENDESDRVNSTTRLGTAGRRINRDTIMEEVAGSSEPQAEPEAAEPEKVYGKPREEEPADKVTAAKKKFRYQISILTLPELDDTISKLLGTMVSVSFQTMVQASPGLLKRLR